MQNIPWNVSNNRYVDSVKLMQKKEKPKEKIARWGVKQRGNKSQITYTE